MRCTAAPDGLRSHMLRAGWVAAAHVLRRPASTQVLPMSRFFKRSTNVFRKVKWTFIGIMMSLLTIVLVATLLVFNMTAYNNDREEVSNALDYALDAGPEGLGLPTIGGPMGGASKTSKSTGAQSGSDTQSSQSGSGGVEVEVGTDGTFEVATGEKSPRFSNNIPVYVVIADSNGNVAMASNTASMDPALLAQAISESFDQDNQSGELSDLSLFYSWRQTYDGYRFAFADSTDFHNTVNSRTLYSVLLGAGVLCVLFVVSIFLSRFAIKPVEEAWASQQRFIADASHELKTPLTVILANNDIVRSHPDSTIQEQSRWIDGTHEEAQKMQGLVQDLLVLAQTEPDGMQLQSNSMKLTPVDFSSLVEKDMLQFEAVAFEGGVELNDDIDEDLHVMADPDKLERVVRVLLDNACKYAKVTDDEPVGEDHGGDGIGSLAVNVSLKAVKNDAVLKVNNNGRPIPPEDLPHVFDRFYRSDKARSDKAEGFGLGLPIAKNIVTNIGGTIDVESSAHDGTTFTAKIPISKNVASEE